MPDQTWKSCERRVAALLGGRRVPVSGRGRGDAPDVACAALAVEVKHRKTLPAWLGDCLDQARAAAAPGRVAVAVLHRRGQRYDEALVVLRLGDFRALVGARGESVDVSTDRAPYPSRPSGRRALSPARAEETRR